MRLLIAILEEKKALEVRLRLYGMDEHWDVHVAENGLQAASLLEMERWDVLLLDSRLRADGTSLWEKLCAAPPLCPPRVLALWQDGPRPAADGAVPADCSGARLAALLSVLAKKPGHSGRQSVFWTRWECAGNGRDGAMRRGACAAGSPSPDWISSPSTGCTRSAPAPSASAPGRWSAASGWLWRACSPWAAFPRSSASSARPSTRTRANPPTGPF